MQVHIVSLHTPSAKGLKQFFSESSDVAYQIKGD